jgi:hypothetical protein
MRRGQSSVESLLGFTGVILAVVVLGWAWPEGFHALVIAIAERVVELLGVQL